ncbi:hypothetical protein [Nonomuraea rubra]|uniref:hypothetical protein n=1 Tax=Nonomuraea rubra TaxID=46180 RepID=UPI003407E3F6
MSYTSRAASTSRSVLAAANVLRSKMDATPREREAAARRLADAAERGMTDVDPWRPLGVTGTGRTAELNEDEALSGALLHFSMSHTLFAADEAMSEGPGDGEAGRQALDRATSVHSGVTRLLRDESSGPVRFGLQAEPTRSANLGAAVAALRDQTGQTITDVLQGATEVTGRVFDSLKQRGGILGAIGDALDKLNEALPLSRLGSRLAGLALQSLEKALRLLRGLLPTGPGLERVRLRVAELVKRLEQDGSPGRLLFGELLDADGVRTRAESLLSAPGLTPARLDEATDALRDLSGRFGATMDKVSRTSVVAATVAGYLLTHVGAAAHLPLVAAAGFVLVIAATLVIAADHLDSWPEPARVKGVLGILGGVSP